MESRSRSQEPLLFNDTIQANIVSSGKEGNATEAEILAADYNKFLSAFLKLIFDLVAFVKTLISS
jgi:ABC-type multidrug transport system fused ATPase/permease subunit